MEARAKDIIKKALNKILSIIGTLSFYAFFVRDVNAQASWYIGAPVPAEPPSTWDMFLRLLSGVLIYIAFPVLIIVLIIKSLKKRKKDASNSKKDQERVVD